MYVPKHFAQQDEHEVRRFIDAVRVADLVTCSSTGLTASLIPLLLVEGALHGSLHGHLARANDQWRTVDTGTEALAIFRGPDAYVTPRWYPSKAETGRVVPTWNYTVVHVHGRVLIHDDPEWTRPLVTRLTEELEARATEPWSIADAPEEYVDRMVKAIVGIEIEISRVEAKWKLSQNQSDRDAAGVAEGLAASGDVHAEELATMMRRLRQQ